MADASTKGSRLDLRRLFRFGFGGRDRGRDPVAGAPAQWVDSAAGVALSLGEMLKAEAGSGGAKVHVVSLKDFRAAVGERWARMADKVMMIAEGIITRHLGAGNFAGKHGGDTFLLVFRKVPEAAARERAAAIAEELGRHLVGAQFSGLEGARICVAELDPAALLDDAGGLDAGKIATAVAAAEPAQNAAAPVAATAPRQDRGRESIEGRATTGPTLVAIDRTAPAKGDPAWARLERERAETSAPRIVVAREKRHSVAFLPSWRAAAGAIDTHFVLPVRHEAGTLVAGDRVLPPGADAVRVADMDADVTEGALRALAEAEGLVVLPLHFTSLADSLFPRLANLFGEDTAAARADRLIVEVTGIPASAATGHVGRAVARARAVAGQVFVRSPLAPPRLEALLPCRPAAIGFDIRDGSVRPEGLGAAVVRFAEAAGGTPVCLWGARRRDDIALAVEHKFAYVNGPALKKEAFAPSPPVPLPREALLHLLAKARR